MVSKIEPIRKITLVDQIVRQLRKEILSSEYSLEDNFPSEKDLTLRFGTSRHTVRSALQQLAKEGLIEIAHGRGNIINDYRLTLGIDVFPELVITSPEIITPDVFSVYRQHLLWLYNRIMITATRKAAPSDEAKLMEIANRLHDKMSVEEYWQNHTLFYRELLRIGDNILLMMYYNSHLHMRQRLLDVGMMKEIHTPPSFNQMYRKQLIKAICTNDTDKVYKIMENWRDSVDKSLRQMFPETDVNI